MRSICNDLGSTTQTKPPNDFSKKPPLLKKKAESPARSLSRNSDKSKKKKEKKEKKEKTRKSLKKEKKTKFREEPSEISDGTLSN